MRDRRRARPEHYIDECAGGTPGARDATPVTEDARRRSPVTGVAGARVGEGARRR
jgi:hypothetical protein